jgi:ABC-type sugar transport system substrate-binding protein
MRNNPRWLAESAAAQRADAVILWASEQNEAMPWEIPRQMKSLRDAGIPVLLLTRQPRQLSALTLEQVMHFVRNPEE